MSALDYYYDYSSTMATQKFYALCWKCRKLIGETGCTGGLEHQKHHILLNHLVNFSPEKLQQLADETQMPEKKRKIRNLEAELEKLRKS